MIYDTHSQIKTKKAWHLQSLDNDTFFSNLSFSRFHSRRENLSLYKKEYNPLLRHFNSRNIHFRNNLSKVKGPHSLELGIDPVHVPRLFAVGRAVGIVDADLA